MIHFKRYKENPIVTPGLYDWRMASTFNPGVIYDNGRFYLFERAAGSLNPFRCSVGLLASDDGVTFRHLSDQPVFTGDHIALPHASIQDPRVVKIDDTYYMNYAVRPYSYSCIPTGVTLPEYFTPAYDGKTVNPADNVTRSAIAVSKNLVHWKHLCYTTPPGIDDRDNVLFPEKINGKYALLRRPMTAEGAPSMWISYSEDLQQWTTPVCIASPKYHWESAKIGASAPPLKTDAGWLVIYHGVDEKNAYRAGALLLDSQNPEKILARSKEPIIEPETYYEKTGLVIPNVVFPTGNVIVNDQLYLYYGCCDTCISLATIAVDELLNALSAEIL